MRFQKLLAFLLALGVLSVFVYFRIDKKVLVQESELSSDEIRKIFINVTNNRPEFTTNYQISEKNYIIGVFLRKTENGGDVIVIQVLNKFAEVWSVSKEKVLGEDYTYVTIIDKFENKVIQGEKYFYFSKKENIMGNAFGGIAAIKFCLIRLSDLSERFLEFGDIQRSDGTIEGKFRDVKSLKSTPEILEFLEKQASISVGIYRPTPQDFNLELANNYKKRWIVDNPEISLYKDYVFTNIKVKYYKDSIFPDKSYFSGIVENSQYKIVSLFRNDILGYRKKDQRYFPIIVQNCNVGCETEVSLVGENEIMIRYSFEKFFVVNLVTMELKSQ